MNGTDGNDKLAGTDGNDAIYGGGGNDALFGGAGDDTLVGGAGDDSLFGGQGTDTFRIEAGGGNDSVADFSLKEGDRIELSIPGLKSFDQLEGRIGGDGDGSVIKFDDGTTVRLRGVPPEALTKETVSFAPPVNEIFGTKDDDKLEGTDGDDAIHGGAGRDYLFGGAGNDTLSGDAGTDTLQGGEGADTFHIEAGGKGDTIADFSAKEGDRIELSVPGLTSFDQLEGRIGAFEDGTIVKLDDGSSVIIRGVPPEALTRDNVTFAPPANEIVGTKDDDKLVGTDGDDHIHGGAGRDYLFGGAGNDTLSGDADDDMLYGGEGRDTFRIEGKGGSDTVGDFSVRDGDRIELSIPGLTSFEQLDGRMGWTGEGTVIKFDDGSVVFIRGVKPEELTRDNVVFDPPICFHTGTCILTPDGPRPVEDLVPGDLVVTRDHGAQPLLWSRRSQHRAPAHPLTWQPILIAPGALGQGLPRRPLRLSPQHRVMVTDPATGAEVLVAARKLTGRPGIRVQLGQRQADYVHLLFARHEILWAEGAPAESLLVAPGSLRHLPADLARRLTGMQPARPILRADPGRFLAVPPGHLLPACRVALMA